MRALAIAAVILAATCASASAQYMGNVTANPYVGPTVTYPSGTFSNPYGNSSNSPKLYDNQGVYHGNLNANPYDPNSVSNPYGQYGSRYSPNSINNPYGAGSPYSPNSPNNPYGTGMGVYR